MYMFNIRPVYAGFPAAGPPFAGFGRRVRAGRIGAFIVALLLLLLLLFFFKCCNDVKDLDL